MLFFSLIENLTPEMFEAMTFEEFIGMIENWLNEKYARIGTYKEFQRLEPGY